MSTMTAQLRRPGLKALSSQVSQYAEDVGKKQIEYFGTNTIFMFNANPRTIIILSFKSRCIFNYMYTYTTYPSEPRTSGVWPKNKTQHSNKNNNNNNNIIITLIITFIYSN